MASSRSHSRNASRSASRSSIPRERSRSRQRSFSPRSRSRSDSLSRKRKADAPQNNGYVNEHDDKWSPRRSPHRRDRSEDLSRSRSRSPQRSSKVVVERLTKNVREGHLREIFEVYGQLKDVDLPMNQQCTKTLCFGEKNVLICHYSYDQQRFGVHSLRASC